MTEHYEVSMHLANQEPSMHMAYDHTGGNDIGGYQIVFSCGYSSVVPIAMSTDAMERTTCPGCDEPAVLVQTVYRMRKSDADTAPTDDKSSDSSPGSELGDDPTS